MSDTKTTRASFRIAMATLLGLSQAHAQPPKDANPIYSPYFKQLKRADQPQWYCCSLETDCREVDQRRNPVTGKWEALISKETFDNPISNAPDTPTWYEIPDSTWVAPSPPELPRPFRGVVRFYNSKIRCADEPLPGG